MCHASLFEYHGKGLGGWRVSPATCAQHWNQCNAGAIPGAYISSKHPVRDMNVNNVTTILITEHFCPVDQHVHHGKYWLQPSAVAHTMIGSLLKLERKSDSSLSLKSVANLPVPLILNVVGNGVFRTSMNSSH